MAIAGMESEIVVGIGRERGQRVEDLDTDLRGRGPHLAMRLLERRMRDLERQREQEQDEAPALRAGRRGHRRDAVSRGLPGLGLVEAPVPVDRRVGDAPVGEESPDQIDDPGRAVRRLPDPRHRRGLLGLDPARVQHVVDRGARVAAGRRHGVVHEVAVDEDVGVEVAEGELRRARDRGEVGVAAAEVQDLDAGGEGVRAGAVLGFALEPGLEAARIGERVREAVARGEAVAHDRDAADARALRLELLLSEALRVELEGDGPRRVAPVGGEFLRIREPRGERLAQRRVAQVEIEGSARIRVVGHELETLPAELLQERSARREIGDAEPELADSQSDEARHEGEHDACDHRPSPASARRVITQKRP